MDRPINPPTDPLDPYIEEAEARWDSTLAEYEMSRLEPSLKLQFLLAWLMSDGFSRRILEDAILDHGDKLIQDLAERLYEKAKDNSKGYD